MLNQSHVNWFIFDAFNCNVCLLFSSFYWFGLHDFHLFVSVFFFFSCILFSSGCSCSGCNSAWHLFTSAFHLPLPSSSSHLILLAPIPHKLPSINNNDGILLPEMIRGWCQSGRRIDDGAATGGTASGGAQVAAASRCAGARQRIQQPHAGRFRASYSGRKRGEKRE